MARTVFVTAKQPLTESVWYFGLLCRRCGQAIALFEDHSRGTGPFPYEAEVLFVTVCPQCRANSHRYRAGEVRAFCPTSAESAMPARQTPL
jgi:hypothetical protein